MTEEDSLAWIREHLSFKQGDVGESRFRVAFSAINQINQEPIVKNSFILSSASYLPDPDNENTEKFTMKFSVDFDETKTAFPDVTVSLTLCLETQEDGTVVFKEIGDLHPVNP